MVLMTKRIFACTALLVMPSSTGYARTSVTITRSSPYLPLMETAMMNGTRAT